MNRYKTLQVMVVFTLQGKYCSRNYPSIKAARQMMDYLSRQNVAYTVGTHYV